MYPTTYMYSRTLLPNGFNPIGALLPPVHITLLPGETGCRIATVYRKEYTRCTGLLYSTLLSFVVYVYSTLLHIPFSGFALTDDACTGTGTGTGTDTDADIDIDTGTGIGAVDAYIHMQLGTHPAPGRQAGRQAGRQVGR